MQELRTTQDLDDAFAAPLAVLYKHSPYCPVSLDAYHEVDSFARGAAVPVYILDVIGGRMLARDVAARTGVTHQSPQVIVLRHGRSIWHASHHRVTSEALVRQTETPVSDS